MKILVCMKQVPAGTKVDIDPETGAMKRLSGETIRFYAHNSTSF